MKEIIFVYPNQLYKQNLEYHKDTIFILIQDSLFFFDKKIRIKFHKQKILLHMLTMNMLSNLLNERGYEVYEIKYQQSHTTAEAFRLAQQIGHKVKIYYPYDYILQKRIQKYADKYNVDFEYIENPNFLNSRESNKDFFENKTKFFFTKYYINQRKKHNILIDENQKPKGGKWSFDQENRKKLPKNINIPAIPENSYPESIADTKKIIDKDFPDHPGSLDDFVYPISFDDAEKWLEKFLENRFELFGLYEDAISRDGTFLFHSVLSPMMNIGLLNPDHVIQRALEFAKVRDIPLNSLEGFLRQIIGWREYIKDLYHYHGSKIRNSKFFPHTNKLNEKWYTGKTQITPLDDTIKKLKKYSYSHHIERLMVVGNVMLMCKIDPDDVYRWFMEMYIDSYDWVMVANIYSMSQFADGGMIVTKPYFSSSNYIIKMSDYKKSEEWTAKIDDLFWNFMNENKEFLAKNPRMSFLLKNLEKKNLDELSKNAKSIIKSLVE